jgi:hypothetical protein
MMDFRLKTLASSCVGLARLPGQDVVYDRVTSLEDIPIFQKVLGNIK